MSLVEVNRFRAIVDSVNGPLEPALQVRMSLLQSFKAVRPLDELMALCKNPKSVGFIEFNKLEKFA